MNNLRLKMWMIMTIASVMAFSGVLYGQDMKTYTAQSRENIDNYYKIRENELRLRAEDQIQQVEKAENARLSQEDLFRKNRFFEDNKFMPNETLLSKKDIALAGQRVDEAKQRILKDLNEEIAKLERQKEYFLETELVPRTEVKPPPYTVSGIVCSDDKATAVLDGIIFSAGDTVKGARVIKIHRDSVEFEKNGNRWSQKVGEPPKDFWR